MSTPKIIGDTDGIKLWEMMSKSNNPIENEYFLRLSNVATQSGIVFFSDIVTQMNAKLNNQAVWKMEWNGSDWEISLFHVPDGASRVTARMINVKDVAVEINVEDL